MTSIVASIGFAHLNKKDELAKLRVWLTTVDRPNSDSDNKAGNYSKLIERAKVNTYKAPKNDDNDCRVVRLQPRNRSAAPHLAAISQVYVQRVRDAWLIAALSQSSAALLKTCGTAERLRPVKSTVIGPGERLHDPQNPTRSSRGERLHQNHSAIGGRLLQRIIAKLEQPEPFLLMSFNIARHHHEKYNGGGYPDGLAGDYIPLEARIYALGDGL